MVTNATRNDSWDRANYGDLESTRQPQAIGQLMTQVLSRYNLIAPVVASDDRHYEDDEELHTLAVSTAM